MVDYLTLDDSLPKAIQSDPSVGRELQGIDYRVLSVSASLPEESSDRVMVILDASIDTEVGDAEESREELEDERNIRRIRRRQKQAEEIMNANLISAIFERVASGDISREEAIRTSMKVLKENDYDDMQIRQMIIQGLPGVPLIPAETGQMHEIDDLAQSAFPDEYPESNHDHERTNTDNDGVGLTL